MANISSIIKASSAIVKVSNKLNKDNKTNKVVTSSKIIQSPKSESFNKKNGGGLVRRDSFSLTKNGTKKSGSSFESFGLGENVKQIRIKVIQIDSLLKGTTSLHKKYDKLKSRAAENKKRGEREDRLEKIPKTDKEAKKLPPVPGAGFLSGIMRFFMNMLIGWFALKFLKHLPLLLKIIQPLGYVVDWIIDFSIKLLDGLATFVDWGFKAYEFTRNAIKQIGGEESLKVFDKFSSALTTFMNLAIIAGMLSTMGGGGGRGPKPGPRARPRPGTGGRPKVTRSGGKPQGRPDFRNPFRQRPNVTQGGKGGGFRMPWNKPKVTGGGGGGFKLPKLNPKGLVTGARTLGIGLLLDYAVDTFITQPLNEAVVNKGVEKISSLPPKERKKRIELLLAEIKKEKDWQSGAGGAFDKAIKLGGLLGETSSEIKVRQLEETLARLKEAGYAGGGLVTVGAAGGGMISRAGQFLGGIKRGFGDIARRLSFNMPSVSEIIPGSKIGGQQEIEKIFPNPSGKSVSPLQYLTDTGNTFSETDYLGPIFNVVTKSILGSKITNEDYRNIGLGMNAWIASGINEKKLKGGISPAFAEGGFVQQVSSSEDISDWAAESAKRLISPKVAETNKDLLRNLLLQKNYPGQKEDTDMDMEPGQDPSLEVGPGGTVTGGNADFWALVAIASLESGNPQGRADVAQSIYNRLASGIYSGRSIKELIVSGNGRQYQPVGRAVREFRSISDKESAINAVMVANKLSRSQAEKFINDTASAIQNKDLQESAKQFVGGRTDFWAQGLTPPANGVGYTVRHGHRFGWFVGPAAIAYGKKNPGPASAPSLGDIVVMGGPGGGPGNVPTGKSIGWQEWGNYLQKLGFKPTENVFFGGVKYPHRTPDHGRNAMDAGYWKDNNYVEATKKYERKFKPLEGSSFSQILGPISDWDGHGEGKPGNTHLHFTAKNLDSRGRIPVTPNLQKIMSTYAKGGLAGAFGPEIALIGEKGKEGVLDADTTAAIEKYAPGLLFSLNQGNYEGSIKALRAYASYEMGSPQTIVVSSGGEDSAGDSNMSSSEISSLGSSSSSDSYDPYEILERLPG